MRLRTRLAASTFAMHGGDLGLVVPRRSALGLAHRPFTDRYAGRDLRPTDVYGSVVQGILA